MSVFILVTLSIAKHIGMLKRRSVGKTDVSDKVGFVDNGRDIPQRVYNVCSQMIHHLFSLHKVVKVCAHSLCCKCLRILQVLCQYCSTYIRNFFVISTQVILGDIFGAYIFNYLHECLTSYCSARFLLK